MPVTAYKNGKKQVFSDLGWKILGKNKGGWAEEVPKIVTNTNTNAPDMGPKNPAVEAKTQVVTNTSENKTDNSEENSGESKTQTAENTNESTNTDSGEKNSVTKTDDDKKAEFMKAVEGLTRSSLRDYFDSQNVKYEKQDNVKALQQKLADHLGYDIVKLQEAAL